MKILVTGGAGFIGSNLCDILVRDEQDVICMDSLITGSKDNINHLYKYNNFRFIKHDICVPFYLEVDRIYNCACPASPIHYKKHSIETLQCNTTGIFNLLKLANMTGARLLQTSTSEVYGDPLETPQKETYWGNVNSFGPRACYDEGKRVAEAIIYEYLKWYPNCRIARIFNTYGPNMMVNDGRIVSNFIVQALTHKNITIYGDGEFTRSFCYVDDTCNGLIKLMESEIITPVNIGNPNEKSIKEIAKLIRFLTASDSQLTYLDKTPDDPKRRCPDITKAEQVLGYKPEVSLEEGLLTTIGYFKRKLGMIKE